MAKKICTRFEVKKKLPCVKLDSNQKEFLESVVETLSSIPWEAENIHNAIYESCEKQKIPIKMVFAAIYQIILGQEKGPRAGFFLSSLDKEFVIKRVKEAIK